MFGLLKKTLSVWLIGFGLGILFVVLLPFTGWLFVMGFALVAIGIACLLN